MAFGNRNYLFMAAHMAMSIKANLPKDSDISIKLVHDHNFKYLPADWHQFFDVTQEIEDRHLYYDAALNPGWAKCNIYYYLECDKNIYLDVDGICLKDITPLFDQQKYYATEVIGRGTKDEEINYSWWATNENIWDFFELEDDQKYCSIQSSFSYIRKGRDSKSLFSKIKKNFNYPKDKLKNEWGKTMPDELIVAGTCAKVNHDPGIEGNAVFFGQKIYDLELHEIKEKYYINSLYGNGSGNTLVKDRYKKWYDRMMRNYARSFGMSPLGKTHQIMRGKHAG